MTHTFTEADIGCHADGALGHDHCREVLESFVDALTEDDDLRDDPQRGGLLDSLRGPMPDDAWDELKALDILQDASEPSLTWGMADGNLMLQANDWEGWLA